MNWAELLYLVVRSDTKLSSKTPIPNLITVIIILIVITINISKVKNFSLTSTKENKFI